jgi:hypothetical protein
LGERQIAETAPTSDIVIDAEYFGQQFEGFVQDFIIGFERAEDHPQNRVNHQKTQKEDEEMKNGPV